MSGKLSAILLTAILAVSVAAAPNAPSAPANLSAAEIAAKNVAARGGLPAWRAVHTLSMTGKMEAGGNERSTIAVPGRRGGAQMPAPRPKEQALLPFVMEMRRPHKMRFELQFQGKTAVQVFDGVNGWKLRPFLGRNEVEPFTQEELKAASMETELDGPLVDYAAKGTRVELEGLEKVDGRDAYKLKLTMKGDQVRHLWINTETFLDVKIDGEPRRMDGKMRPVEVYMRDYRSVNGLNIPHLLETEVQGYKPTHKMTIESVSVNSKLDDSAFTKPTIQAK